MFGVTLFVWSPYGYLINRDFGSVHKKNEEPSILINKGIKGLILSLHNL